mgnify:CR=1 FL=1
MKPRLALFLHQPKCSVQSGNGIIKALDSHYNFKIFTKHELEDNFFDDVDMVVVPGGIGDSDTYRYLMKVNAHRIRKFVNDGGRYLGICMGAYWAGHHYLNILNGTRVEQYIKRPGTDTRRPHAKACPVVWEGNPMRMYFYDGCSILGDESKFDVIARYANNDPMAVMQGRIGLIGCHPESEKFWYDERKYMIPHWHYYHHHYLLLDFVNKLMRK